jgi:hypothetical protein
MIVTMLIQLCTPTTGHQFVALATMSYPNLPTSKHKIHLALNVGNKNRTVGATLMNADSSRSHSIFTITIETSERREGDEPDADPHIRVGPWTLAFPFRAYTQCLVSNRSF